MSIHIINILANCIHISKKYNNIVLKDLLFNYASKKLNKKQILFLYIKIASVKEDTELYYFFDNWIKYHNKKMIKQLLYFEY
jgi:hypothetical protein